MSSPNFPPGAADNSKWSPDTASQHSGAQQYPPQYPDSPQYPIPDTQQQWWAWPSQYPAQGPWSPPPPVIPFRPLTVGELFEGTFAAVRANPKVMFTISVSVMLIIGLVGAIMNGIVFSQAGSLDFFSTSGLNPFYFEAEYDFGLSGFAGILQLLFGLAEAGAGLLVSGMLVLAVTNAVVANNMDLSSTWQQLRPRFGRLILTAILIWLIITALVIAAFLLMLIPIGAALSSSVSGNSNPGAWVVLAFLGFLAIIGVVVWIAIRLFFATMVVVVEDTSPGHAIARSWRLTNGAFWRCFGRLLLVGIVMGVVMSVLGGALAALTSLIMAFAPLWVSMSVTTLLVTALAGVAHPISAAYTALMYIDERIRKENLSPALQSALAANREAAARNQPQGFDPGVIGTP